MRDLNDYLNGIEIAKQGFLGSTLHADIRTEFI